jgi:DNA helicase-2/ATP-dependent DNA helicase PcrA
MGTTFHSWIEGHYSRASMLEPDELPGATDDEATEATLRTLRDNFLASEWAGRTPVELEVAVETMLAGVSVRGRIDAVFRDPADPEGYVVVDWKSGPPPAAAAAAHRALQLASYRLAWCRLRDVDPDRVRAAFFHAATGETVWPDLAGESDLEALLRAIPGA